MKLWLVCPLNISKNSLKGYYLKNKKILEIE